MVNVENQIVGKSGRRIMLTESTCKNAYALLSLCVGNTTEMQIFKQLIKEYFEPHPYKFEDLKPNMWVWDDVNEDCIQIAKINEYGGIYWYGALTEYEADKFKENRFFPVTKAMQYQG